MIELLSMAAMLGVYFLVGFVARAAERGRERDKQEEYNKRYADELRACEERRKKLYGA